jgi:glutamine amidotransferase
MSVVTVIDYGSGNLLSVARAFEHCGVEVLISGDPQIIAQAERLVLPGVGAFADGMAGLESRGLTAVIKAFADSGRPLLGICLGMQMLASSSEEFGAHVGLDLIPGRVIAIPNFATDGTAIKVPFIGWTPVHVERPGVLRCEHLVPDASTDAVYLVHSYHLLPVNPDHLLASYSFGGHDITAAVSRKNITGLQFHPEKSGEVGLSILKKFVSQSSRP